MCNACGSEDHWFATFPRSDKRELMRKNRRALEHRLKKSPSPTNYFAMATFLTQLEGPPEIYPGETDAALNGDRQDVYRDDSHASNTGPGSEGGSEHDATDDASAHFGDAVDDPSPYRSTYETNQQLRDAHELLGSTPSDAEPVFTFRRGYKPVYRRRNLNLGRYPILSLWNGNLHLREAAIFRYWKTGALNGQP
jgi:hypothetical protein